jgi:hypothetical protein
MDNSGNNTGILHDTREIVPYVGMTGLYTLKAPYTSLINTSIEYTCVAVNTISNMVAQGLDPLTDIYLANGDTQAVFDADALLNHSIITLQSGIGDVIEVPANALAMLPNADGVLYSNVLLGVSLSAVANEVDLTTLKNEIKDVVLHKLGAKCTVFETTVGASAVVSHARHTAIEAARQANINSTTTTLRQNELLLTQNLALIAKVTVLENWIKAHH